ncbi:MAG TPA: tRNA (adenosine(37)-N6)-dimethylallyltransferase MiaA [Oscillospiraceae bacterium]|nr:tRNA (adenosine(37)-N6)-dimethylallyltransferase MiaA [Oscillospiraceae bacterium]
MQKLIVIAGPTAVGKSAVALELAKRLQSEIISADSVQVYRGLDIGTAKPSAAEQAQVPHHLLNIKDPHETYTVAEFQKDARLAIAQVHQRSKVPLLVGGTGLYLRAVVWGFAFSESGINHALRKKLRSIAEINGPEVLHHQLQAVDPQTARQLHPHDLRRVIRALEVYAQNRRPISEQVEKTPTKPVYDTVQFVLTRSRETLYERIEARVEAMIEAGLIREVQFLLATGVSPEAKAMQSLGYKQIAAYLTGQMPLVEAIERIKRDTRRFAKRQLTWFRREKEMHWINLDDLQLNEVVKNISNSLAGNYF